MDFNLDEYLKESDLKKFGRNAEEWEILDSSKKLQFQLSSSVTLGLCVNFKLCLTWQIQMIFALQP